MTLTSGKTMEAIHAPARTFARKVEKVITGTLSTEPRGLIWWKVLYLHMAKVNSKELRNIPGNTIWRWGGGEIKFVREKKNEWTYYFSQMKTREYRSIRYCVCTGMFVSVCLYVYVCDGEWKKERNGGEQKKNKRNIENHTHLLNKGLEVFKGGILRHRYCTLKASRN